MEPWFRHLLQVHGHDRLGQAVCDRGRTEQTFPYAMRLRRLNALHRWLKVAPRRHPVPNPIEVVLQIGLEVREGLPIHSRGTLVRRTSPVRLPQGGMFEMVRLGQIPRWCVPCAAFVLRYERSKVVVARAGAGRG